MISRAIISKDGMYRYSLSRRWGGHFRPTVMFIMLNPSTADASFDDPTINKCIGFAKRWGYGGLHVCNLFAYRATDPKEMKKVKDPIGWENYAYLMKYAEESHTIVCAWGNDGKYMGQGNKIKNFIKHKKLWCFKINKTGEPKHPLYVPYSKELIKL